ncbi:hypothetical protein ABZX92_06560 [Lentzea sp. NPDC006480]|uniref:hypothetical protein n=1 Tax=Lentzea sp. NPDC006480 TaxID=3157176 RepID=UPI0033AD763E
MTSPEAQIWERYAAKYEPRRAVNAAGATTWLNWAQYPDHGPDETVEAGFSKVVAETLDAPESGMSGTVLVHARAAGARG